MTFPQSKSGTSKPANAVTMADQDHSADNRAFLLISVSVSLLLWSGMVMACFRFA